MTVREFLKRIRQGEGVDFSETQSMISEHYRYTTVKFSNGLGCDRIENDAGINEGSCKIFSFALLHGLEKDETLKLFGDYYWIDVLQNPGNDDHLNIRTFMKYGWDEIHF